ncbi:DUF3987 domain-containing protein [Acinetobacter baumannii]|uniref:DUF3987 domain-containing protein n=1 Tax=Acinetobacter baumannii TaxID=470 RepID=UPI001FF4A398|nr:DUF3987 domain-containing protein [Acinetobacter baumannii]MCJ9253888.1 DUF3987 domain-containing protein [Acinetobacter baumannii]
MLNESSNQSKNTIDWQECTNWQAPIPLKQLNPISNIYPIDALPMLGRGAAQAISEYVQAPIGMTAQCVIGAMAHIAQAHVNAPSPFDKQNGEPCSLYLLSEGQSGSRKSTSRNLANRMIIAHERRNYDEYLLELERWEVGLNTCDKKERGPYLEEMIKPKDPSSLFSDITLESLQGLYIDEVIQNASISSDEAAQFFSGHTMKSDTRNHALGGFAQLFDDGYVERTRSKANLNGSGRAFDVRLSFNLQGQHEILADALKDPILRGQGFLPRFILTIPENLAGTRFKDEIHRTKDLNLDTRLIKFWDRCNYLLDKFPLPHTEEQPIHKRYVIYMNADAEKIDLNFYNEIESLQASGQIYEHMQAFASRASQLTRRLATVFAFFEDRDVIDAEILNGATQIVRHSLNEWTRYSEIETIKESNTEKLIKNIIDKCMKNNTNCILKTLALKGAPINLRKVKEFDFYLFELIELNYVRLVTINKSTYIELNPLLLNH